MSDLNLKLNTDLTILPYEEEVLLLLEDGSIHTGVKVKVDWIRFPGSKEEKVGTRDEYIPVGVSATYDSDTYFNTEPVGYYTYE